MATNSSRMSTHNESGKVVDLQSRVSMQQITADRAAEIRKTIKAPVLKKLTALVSGTFDGVDDALFDMAEKADNNAMQTKYFDGMREVRKRRPSMEKQFLSACESGFENFAASALHETEEGAEKAELSLLDEGDLEETLAINSMAGKAENRLARALFALNQRFTVLASGTKIGDQDNAIGPKRIADAFRTAMTTLEVDIQVKLIMLKLFEKNVMNGLDALYDEINGHLVDSGVLPQLKHQLAGRRGPSAPSSGSVATAGMPDDAQPVLAGMAGDAGFGPSYGGGQAYQQGPVIDSAMQLEMYNTLRSLLAARHPGSGGVGGAQMASGPVFQQTDLLSALSSLQGQVLALQQQAMGYTMTPTQTATAFKEELIQQAQKQGDDGMRVHSADEDTIDLVGMLFEYILQDRNLPSEIQAMLARLQIPYLKVAILDKHMFARKEHPARKLLDELAQAGLGWTEETDKDRRLIEKMLDVVETLLREFDDNVQIFELLLQDFTEFMTGNRKRADVAEQRTAETVRGREKLQSARKLAAKEILQRLEGKRIPEIIRHTLTRPWANVLVLTILRQGEGSGAFRSALRVADELAWSGVPKQSEDERVRLRALIPELEKALRQGLTMVAYQEADIQQLLGELRNTYNRLMEADPEELAQADDEEFELIIEDKRPDAQTPAALAPPPGETTNFVDEIVLGGPSEDDDQQDAPNDEFVQVARNVKIGTWVEFRDDRGNVERAKLSWISPISAKYLFVNRKGLKVADKTVWGLAAELRSKRAQVLEDVPLFDRALDAIVERLKTSPIPEVSAISDALPPDMPPAVSASSQGDAKDDAE